MINFRFHLVSLIAVFLALAVGIVIGSTVVDQAIVDGLRNRIDEVEANADARKEQNDILSEEVSRLESFVGGTAAFAVSGRLEGGSVAVVAERGIDESAVDDSVRLARQAGAVAPGVLWLEDAWLLEDAEERDALAALTAAPADDPDALRRAGLALVAERLSPPGVAAVDDPLVALAEAGFVTFEEVDDPAGTFDLTAFPGPSALALVVGGTESALGEVSVLGDLTAELAGQGVSTLVTEVYRVVDGGPARGAVVAVVRDDGELAAAVATVDDLDLDEGRVAAVLALADLGRAPPVVGHYGHGDGADAAVPTWSPA